MDKLIVTAAVCGAEVTKGQNSNVPYSVDEIADQAQGAYKKGASIIHLHVREKDGTPTQDYHIFKNCVEAIRRRCNDVIIQISTGGSAGMNDSERLEPVKLKPEMASLDCGTINFGHDDIFVNKEKTIIHFAEKMEQFNIKPEIEVFDIGMIDTALRICNRGYIKPPLHFNFVMGMHGGIDMTLRNLAFMVESIPVDSTYTVTGIGKHQFTAAAMAIAAGGNVRVGFEDNIYIEHGILAESNGQMVEKVVKIAGEVGREIASPGDARKILNIKEK